MPDSVAPSRLGTQPIGESAKVADGVYQLKIPVPFPLRFVSVYLIECDDGWTIVDTGFDYPPTYEVWENGTGAVGCDLDRDVVRIVVTHFHPDHLGGARWLQERTGAPVYMLREEIPFSKKLWGGEAVSAPFVEHFVHNGMDREMALSAASAMRTKLLLPEVMLPLDTGETLDLSSSAVSVLHAPGHADHQLVLHDGERGILFAADHLLLEITPNIGLWPESEPRPLARYLESLERMRSLNADLVLPGHGPVFHELAGRISELTLHHKERLDAMQDALEGEPQTPYELSRKLFRGTLTIHQRCFALAETVAHLDHLLLEDRAERLENENILYRS